MNSKKFLGIVRGILIIVIVTVLFAPGSWAASKYKTLHKFHGGAKDGMWPQAGLIFDPAGNLYGTTNMGGAYSSGTVFQLTPNADGSWAEKLLYSFTDDPYTISNLVFDNEGSLFGTTRYGGDSRNGTVFKLTPNPDGSWAQSVLYSFCLLTDCLDGAVPGAGLIFDPAGNLYGTTPRGGAHTWGTVFKLTPNADGSWSESVLHSFCSPTCHAGKNPQAGLIFDDAGNLYGTAYGGTHEHGMVFRLTPNPDGSWTESVLHRFTGSRDGYFPLASLIFDADGNLYGTTIAGGNLSYCGGLGCGVVFQLTPNPDGTWKENILHRFTGGKDGGLPYATLIIDADRNLYGTAWQGGNLNCNAGLGCGVVFKLAPNSNGGWRETVLHRFANSQAAGLASLIFDGDGNLYGTNESHTSDFWGVVYEITP